MEWPPHVTVATVIENNNRFLLVHEKSDGKSVYNQPAGHLEPNETLAEAALRETLEETGWRVQLTHLLGVSQYLSPVNGVTYIRITFVATPIEALENARLDQDIIEAIWLDYEEIIAIQDKLRSPLVLRDIQRYLSGTRLPLDCIYSHPNN